MLEQIWASNSIICVRLYLLHSSVFPVLLQCILQTVYNQTLSDRQIIRIYIHVYNRNRVGHIRVSGGFAVLEFKTDMQRE
jgi:hypothetical protein